MSSTGFSTQRSGNSEVYLVIFCLPVLTGAGIIAGFLFQLWNIFAIATGLDLFLVVIWLNLRKDRVERMQRQREERILRQREEEMQRQQQAVQPQLHPTEETRLRARIAYLEDQLDRRQSSAGLSLSAPFERPDEKEEPEVVAVVDIRRRVQAEDVGPKTEATDKRPTQNGARQPLALTGSTEEEELAIRRKAIEVLLAALDDAVAQGVLTQEGYQAKRSKYRRELRRIEKSLKASP